MPQDDSAGQFDPDDVMVIKSNRKGQSDLILRPVLRRGVKLYVAPLPEPEDEPGEDLPSSD